MYQRVEIHEGMTGEDLKRWRAEQPGEHRNGPGWTQKQAADWAGVSSRTWIRYENGRPIPRIVIKLLMNRRASFDQIVDRIFDTPQPKVEEMGGIIPELAGRD